MENRGLAINKCKQLAKLLEEDLKGFRKGISEEISDEYKRVILKEIEVIRQIEKLIREL